MTTLRRVVFTVVYVFLIFFSTDALTPVTTAEASTAQSATIAAFDAPYVGSPSAKNPAVVAVAATTTGDGYYVLRANGEVDAYGAPSYGSLAPNSLPSGITAVGMALDSATGGYWIVSSNGAIAAFNAPTFGETLVPPGGWGQHPAAVAIASAINGTGYFVLRANGAVYAYGVKAHGSLAGHLHYGTTAPVLAVAIAEDPTTGGYWIATSTGNVIGFDAPNEGSPLASAHGAYNGVPISALAATTSGTSYYVLLANGIVDSYGTSPHGSLSTSTTFSVGGFASALAVDPATGGYYVGIDITSLDGYFNPLRALTSLLPQEIDQGVDYCASGPIYALGDGVVENLYDPGWPSGVFISYQLTSGPAKGRYVYDAENITPKVTVGEHISATTVIGVLHDAKTCLETGWANPPSSPEHAAAHLEYNGKNTTAYGLNFSSLLQNLGARPGLPQPFGPPGPLPSTWPTW
ncbi:MAG TPA: hypothetical protein VIJ40_09215 [Acidimicrobiales bacterium]